MLMCKDDFESCCDQEFQQNSVVGDAGKGTSNEHSTHHSCPHQYCSSSVD